MRPTVIIRHPKERLSKCSLRGLENRPELTFLTYPRDHNPGHPIAGFGFDDLNGRVVLRLNAPPLSPADAEAGLLLVDGTWALAEKINRALDRWPGLTLIPRSLPGNVSTAYPRRQTDCPDPDAGLASVEALYLAHRQLGLPTAGLLDHYPWRDAFLSG